MKKTTFEFMRHSVEQEKKALDMLLDIMEEKDYKLSDFALIHPGGAVGKRIN